jgi:hypothetical protein
VEIAFQCRLISRWMLTSWIQSRAHSRFAGCAVEEFGADIERVAEAVRGVDAHHQSARAARRQFYSRGCGYAGLADSAFAAVEKYPHLKTGVENRVLSRNSYATACNSSRSIGVTGSSAIQKNIPLK